jgi:hypothetical protein
MSSENLSLEAASRLREYSINLLDVLAYALYVYRHGLSQLLDRASINIDTTPTLKDMERERLLLLEKQRKFLPEPAKCQNKTQQSCLAFRWPLKKEAEVASCRFIKG